MAETFLVADIGGTNARFALSRSVGPLQLEAIRQLRTADFSSPVEAVCAYLQDVNATITHACMAVAGPRSGQRVTMTNASWDFEIHQVADALEFTALHILNDFEALAFGTEHVNQDELICVCAGSPDGTAPVLVTGPGTGLGQAILLREAGQSRVVATQAGYVSFAPQDEMQREIHGLLRKVTPRVHNEHILSGNGLLSLYKAFCEVEGKDRLLSTQEEVTQSGVAGRDETALATLRLFCRIMGQVAGDAVLASGARGGVRLAGGILPRLPDILLAGDFAAGFANKAPMENYLASVPVHLVTAENTGLLGASAWLRQLTENGSWQ